MQAMQPIRGMGLGRPLVGIVALAAALAYGSVAAGVEWASSRTVPGKPY